MSELALLCCAFILDALIGDPRTPYHPVCLMGNCAYALEKHLRRGHNGFGMCMRGAVAWMCVALLFTMGAWGCVRVASVLGGQPAAFCLCACILAVCMAPKSLSQHAQAIISPLEQGNIHRARQQLAMIVGRDVHNLDVYAIARASIESVGENLVDAVLASLFWASVGLLWGYDVSAALVVLHRVSNVLDAQWGKKNDTYVRFGTFSARIDDALNACPARLAFVCICCASLLQRIYTEKAWPHTGKARLFHLAWKYRYAHASPNSAWSEAAFASALHLTLSGPVAYAGRTVNYPPIGEGTRLATPQHIQHAIQLHWFTTYLWLACSGLTFFFFA